MADISKTDGIIVDKGEAWLESSAGTGEKAKWYNHFGKDSQFP